MIISTFALCSDFISSFKCIRTRIIIIHKLYRMRSHCEITKWTRRYRLNNNEFGYYQISNNGLDELHTLFWHIFAYIWTQLTAYGATVYYVFCVSLFHRFISSDCKFLRIYRCDCYFAINLFFCLNNLAMTRAFDFTHCANTCFDIQKSHFRCRKCLCLRHSINA